MVSSHGLLSRLRTEIDSLPVLDVHTHMRPAHPHGRDLAEILLYHHLGTELMSAGMPAATISTSGLPHEVADPGIEPLARVRAALPYLSRIRNTTVGGFARTILRDLYGVPGGELTEENLDEAWTTAAALAAQPDWAETVLGERCNIAHSVTVDHLDTDPGLRFSFMSEACNGFFLPDKALDRARALANLEGSVGVEIHDSVALARAVESVVNRQIARKVLALAFWLPADFIWREADDWQIAEALTHLRAGHNGPSDRDVVATFALRQAVSTMSEAGLQRVQLFLGAEVKLPHRSVSVASGQFARELAQLFNEFEEVDFEVLAAADLHTQDVCILAKHFPNVRVAGYWWHTLYPFYIRKALECRLDIVPGNKITAFFSDAYTAEWCYPKVKLVKRILTEVLVAKVEAGDYTEDYAIELARQVLFENPRDFYGLAAAP